MLTAPGVVNAIYWTIRACVAPGETVVIQTPVYQPFYRIVPDGGANLTVNPLIDARDHYEIDFADLEAKFRSGAKMLIFCSPHNPVGRVWRRDELEQLVALAKKYDVMLVSDEIHCDFVLFDNRFTSLASFYPEYEKIVVLIAPSKTFNVAGLKFSLIIAPDADIRARIAKTLDTNCISASNPLSIEAARAAYERGDRWLDCQLAHIEKNFRIVADFFRDNFPEAIVYHLEGTYLVWVRISFLGRPVKQITEVNRLGLPSIRADVRSRWRRFRPYQPCLRRRRYEALDRFESTRTTSSTTIKHKHGRLTAFYCIRARFVL